MEEKGDIPEREEIAPPDNPLSPAAITKVDIVDEIIDSGGIAHVYLKSVNHVGDDDGEDIHLHEFNTHRFTEIGVIYYHADDTDTWIMGDDIGMIERHYEE
jgi:hypoxanthine phosphoribosyltransferase